MTFAKFYGKPFRIKMRESMLNDRFITATKYFYNNLLKVCVGINLLNFKALFAALKILGVYGKMSAKKNVFGIPNEKYKHPL